MAPLSELLPNSFLVVMAAMTALWLLSLSLGNASIVDPFWGMGFILVTWLTVAKTPPERLVARSWLLTALVTIWGLRLSLYLLWRNCGHGEDRRYRAMREQHGSRFWWVSLLTVFWLQGVILWIVSMPIQDAIWNGPTNRLLIQTFPLSVLDAVGISVWLVGFLFESIGDFQMSRFQAAPANAGQVMDRGLWRYTRHPNYFGDFCVWWGLFLIAAGAGAGWAIFSPLLMSFLLLKVSGVTLLEQTITTRRPEYAEYQQRTNSFLPGLPRKRK